MGKSSRFTASDLFSPLTELLRMRERLTRH